MDLSHVHATTMKAAIEVSRAPIIFSHSSSKAVCNHPRDVPDEILRDLSRNGGIVMVTFVAKFVAGEFWVRGGKVGATVLEVADHIDHIRATIGIDYIGLGGDFDGCREPARGLEDVSCYPILTAELLSRGYTKVELVKIMSGNMFRVLREAERISSLMKAERILPSEATPATYSDSTCSGV